MSYLRFSAESDAYVYHHYLGFIECCGCSLTEADALTGEEFGFFKAYTARAILEHLDLHRSVGHKIPQRAYDRIKEEYPDLDSLVESYP